VRSFLGVLSPLGTDHVFGSYCQSGTDIYTHVLMDYREIDRPKLLERVVRCTPPCTPKSCKTPELRAEASPRPGDVTQGCTTRRVQLQNAPGDLMRLSPR